MSRTHRLLAIRPGGIGDCILCFPALESLRARCDYLEIWTPRAVTPLIKFADRVRAIADTGLDLVGLPGLSAPNPLTGFDTIVSWYGTNREEFRQATGHLPMEFHSALPPMECPVHAVEFFCNQLSAAAKAPSIPAKTTKRDWIAIHPFSGAARKNWPLANFRALATELKTVEWCASAEQNLPGAFTTDNLAVLAQWLAQAKLYVGNDSGITHLAAAVGTPTIAIFQDSNPAIWAPRNARILTRPTVDEVRQAIREETRLVKGSGSANGFDKRFSEP